MSVVKQRKATRSIFAPKVPVEGWEADERHFWKGF